MIELFAWMAASWIAPIVALSDNKRMMKDLLIPNLKPITPSHDETYGGLCVIHKEDGWNGQS